jgi:hypothetical protein
MGMIPKDKAKELFDKYYEIMISANNILNISRAKQYALIAVDEMIEESVGYLSIDRNKYWKKVKQEIEKL